MSSTKLGTIALLLALTTSPGCRPAATSLPSPSPEAVAATEELLALIARRLGLMHDVARWKWNAHAAIADPAREEAFLKRIAADAPKHGLDAERTVAFFAAQIEAARQIQEADFRAWKAAGHGPFSDVPDLKETIRPQIDRLGKEMLAALARVHKTGSLPDADLRRRAESLVVGDAITPEVRATALRPLISRAVP
jgi:chorismate mutase-like protein